MNWIAVIGAIISFLSAIFAFSRSRIARQRIKNQVILDILRDYRTPQMQLAVQYLHNFYRECEGDNLVEKYEQIRMMENRKINELEEEQKIKLLKNTLHYQRRLVADFYQYVAALNRDGVLPHTLFYGIWTEYDLSIIPRLIIPIENHLRQIFTDRPNETLGEASDLYKLYAGKLNRLRGTGHKKH